MQLKFLSDKNRNPTFMYTRLLVIVLAAISMAAHGQGGQTSKTPDGIIYTVYDMDEILPATMKMLQKRGRECMGYLLRKEYESLYNTMRPKEDNYGSRSDFMARLKSELAVLPETGMENVRLKNCKYVYFREPPKKGYSYSGTSEKGDQDYMNVSSVAGFKQQAVLLYEVKSYPFNYKVSLMLVTNDGGFGLRYIPDIFINSYFGRSSYDYLELSRTWKSEGDKLSAYLAALMAEQLSVVLENRLITREYIEARAVIDDFTLDDLGQLAVNGENIKIHNYHFKREKDQIIPVIAYITNTDFSHEAAQIEMAKLITYLGKNHYAFLEVFSFLELLALKEEPQQGQDPEYFQHIFSKHKVKTLLDQSKQAE